MTLLFGAGMILLGIHLWREGSTAERLREEGHRAEARFSDLRCSSSTTIGRQSSSRGCSVHVELTLPSGEVVRRRMGLKHARAYCRGGPDFAGGTRAPVYFDPAHPEKLVFGASPCVSDGASVATLVYLCVLGLVAIAGGAWLLVLTWRKERRPASPA